MGIISSNGKHVQGLQFFPHEETFYVQREHVIALFFPAIAIFFATVLTISFIYATIHFRYIEGLFYVILVLFLSLAALTLLSTFAVYTFMHWFYQFYIITNKRLIHIHYFRVGGFHLDEVFYLQTKPTEVERQPRNFLLDFLGIEDVSVYFKNLERTIPFVFENPADSGKIEKLIEEHLLEGSGR